MKSIVDKLKEVTPEVFYRLNYNLDNNVKRYPYIVYDYSTELDSTYSDFVFLSLHLHDKNTSPIQIFQLEKEIRKKLNGLMFDDDTAYYICRFNSINTPPLIDEWIQRLDVEYDIQVYYKHPEELRIENGS